MPKGFSEYNQSGWKHTQIVKDKIRKKRKTQIITKDTIYKMRVARLGKKHSKLELKKMSESQKGRVFSAETRLKMSMWQIGKKNNHWKGGITSLRRRIRNLGKYYQWRKTILARDGQICVLCGKQNSNIIDHYPVTFQKIIKKFKIKNIKDALFCKILWRINNGRTLCEKCNYEVTFAK